MTGWKRLLLVGLSLSLLGCSTTPADKPGDGMTPTAGQTTASTTKVDEEEVGGQAGSVTDAKTTIVDEDGVEIVSEPADTKPPEPQTGMHIEEGVDRLFQNGPSAEEIKRYTRKPERRSYKYNNEGDNGAPVFDDNVEEIIL